MSQYLNDLNEVNELCKKHNGAWRGINPVYAARMKAQNRFKTGLDIAKYTAAIMRKDMADYDADSANYTQSLGCWHGFVGQQKMLAVKKHHGTTDKRYLYLSGWMVAALRSELGSLPDQSMHEKTTVPSLIEELYTFLRQADAKELGELFNQLDDAMTSGGDVEAIQKEIDNYQTHIVPIIADIDAGFGNEEATYLLAKKMIEAGACCIQIENQVSDAKQCGHQDGKVTVPHEDFLSKINAVRYAFLELGVEDGVIVARTDSLGAGLTQKIPVFQAKGDLAYQYNRFLETTPIQSIDDIGEGDQVLKIDGQLVKPVRLPNGLYKFRENTGFDRVVLDCITSMQSGADLLWIETEKPHVRQIGDMVDAIREQAPNAKLVYNNSPSFNWTLNFRQQVYDAWSDAGKDVAAYKRDELMSVNYDDTELATEADEKIRSFQSDESREAGISRIQVTSATLTYAA
jgi:isocitrate lyase